MRVAILSESSADEAGLRVIVDALLGFKSVPVDTNLRSRGWNAVQNVLLATAKKLHYLSDTDALVVVVDSNHTYLSGGQPKNRLRDFQALVESCRNQLRPDEAECPSKSQSAWPRPPLKPGGCAGPIRKSARPPGRAGLRSAAILIPSWI